VTLWNTDLVAESKTAQSSLDVHVRRIVDQFPPLTEVQRAEICFLLRQSDEDGLPTAEAGEGG
jgi:hypothetical protein